MGRTPLFPSRKGDAFDDVFLENEEYDNNRYRSQRACGHRQRLSRHVLRFEYRQSNRNRHDARIRNGNKRPEKVIPGGQEDEYTQRRQSGTA